MLVRWCFGSGWLPFWVLVLADYMTESGKYYEIQKSKRLLVSDSEWYKGNAKENDRAKILK